MHRDVDTAIEKAVEALEVEILSPHLGADPTQAKRIQRHALLAVKNFIDGKSETINLNN